MTIQRIEQLLRRKTNLSSYIPAIDGIRLLAIILVFLYHSWQCFPLKPDSILAIFFSRLLLENGFKGVPIFFMICGFVLAVPFKVYYTNNGKKVSIKRYFLRRLIRLEPPYIITMLLFFFLQLAQKPEELKKLLSSLFFSILYLHNIYYRDLSYINKVAWSLEIEIQFYIIAPLIFTVFKLAPVPRRVVLLVATFFFSCYPLIDPLPFANLFRYLQFFLPGILLCDLYRPGMPECVKSNWMVVLAIANFLFLLWIPVDKHWYLMPVYPVTIFLLLFSILSIQPLSRLFSSKIISLLGGMTYSIYLIHHQVIVCFLKITSPLLHYGYLVSFCLQITCYAIVTLVLCTFFYLSVEKPFMSLASRKETS